MAIDEQVSRLRSGVDTWNIWRAMNPKVAPDLSQADLQNTNLARVDLLGAILVGTDLTNSTLDDADMRYSDLSGATLTGAHLRRANLSRANLTDADLRNSILISADITRANLSGTDLRNADLTSADLALSLFQDTDLSQADVSDAVLYRTAFVDCDLSQPVGIEKVRHGGPSFIGLDVFLKTKGKIPDVFLRGCGLPDDVIAYIPAMCQHPFDFYSCFISHSTKDMPFCERLYADLQARNVRTWFFPEDATWGKSVWGEIDGSIKIYDKLVVVCSKNSLRSSPVLREIERALQREDDERKAGHAKHILFPITLDSYVFDEWEHERKADVLSKVVGRFQGWKSADKYGPAFEKLLKALRTESEL